MRLEKNVKTSVRIYLSKIGVRVFNNPVGLFWAGVLYYVDRKTGETVLKPGARKVYCGLFEGSSDLIGWRSIEITPDMVGNKVAIFTAIETKGKRGRASSEQLNFISQVKKSGGIAGLAFTAEQAEALVSNFKGIK